MYGSTLFIVVIQKVSVESTKINFFLLLRTTHSLFLHRTVLYINFTSHSSPSLDHTLSIHTSYCTSISPLILLLLLFLPQPLYNLHSQVIRQSQTKSKVSKSQPIQSPPLKPAKQNKTKPKEKRKTHIPSLVTTR